MATNSNGDMSHAQVVVRGRIVRGLRAASGASRGPRRGTVALQMRFFRKAVPEFDTLFDRKPRVGTLNVAVPGHDVVVLAPEYHLEGIRWEPGHPLENFYLSACRLDYAGRSYRGLLYIPDPATKPQGLPTGLVAEVLTQRIPMIRYGSRVTLHFRKTAIALVPSQPCSRRRARLVRPARGGE